MKLALVISSLGPGGAERVMALMANYWAERGDEPILITLDTPETDAYPLDPRVTRVALGLVRESPGLVRPFVNNWRRISGIRRTVQACGAPIVLSFEDRTNVLVVVATLGLSTRCVLSERTDPTKHRIGGAWKALRRVVYPLADALVVQTPGLIPWARSVMLRRHAVRAIPNPMRDVQPIVRRRRAEHPDQRQRVLVAVGRLRREKGYDMLIEAFSRVAKDFPLWTLRIVGEGPERKRLEELARAFALADRIIFAGWLREPAEALASAAVFVMASRYEGFPNALLEAMSIGLPVISTACGACVEMIDDGVSGLLVPVDGSEELTQAMRRLMQDQTLRQRLGENALAASQRYKQSYVMPMWEAVLGKTCVANDAPRSCS